MIEVPFNRRLSLHALNRTMNSRSSMGPIEKQSMTTSYSINVILK
jgi:hypothetical protein